VADQTPLDEAAEQLYALPPERFVAARDERVRAARAAGDRPLAAALGALRRPTTGAWAVNLLVREQPELLDQLLALGADLRRAQQELRGPALRELTAQRQRVVTELVRAARRATADAGHPVSADTGFEVEQTLHAALADAEVADDVRAGRLVRPVERSGFGVGGTGAGATRTAAAPPAAPAPTPRSRAAPAGDTERADREAARRHAERERLAADRDAAQADLNDANAEFRAATSRLTELERARDQTAALVESLEEQLNAARRAARDSSSGIRDARQRHDRARRACEAAERRLADLTARLAALDR
jgi:hypothetical protein